jgi:hypothetical protein
MSDESQIEIPQSFVALYVEPGRLKPSATREVLAARYELCEDMANMLTEHAKSTIFELGCFLRKFKIAKSFEFLCLLTGC